MVLRGIAGILTPLIHHLLNDARLFPENENLSVSLWVVFIVSLVQLVLVAIMIGAAAWLCRRLSKVGLVL
jgi:flagellar biogenesis protein FliO